MAIQDPLQGMEEYGRFFEIIVLAELIDFPVSAHPEAPARVPSQVGKHLFTPLHFKGSPESPRMASS